MIDTRTFTYVETLRLAKSAGADAANRRMRAAGRKAWSAGDYTVALDTFERIMRAAGLQGEHGSTPGGA